MFRDYSACRKTLLIIAILCWFNPVGVSRNSCYFTVPVLPFRGDVIIHTEAPKSSIPNPVAVLNLASMKPITTAALLILWPSQLPLQNDSYAECATGGGK